MIYVYVLRNDQNMNAKGKLMQTKNKKQKYKTAREATFSCPPLLYHPGKPKDVVSRTIRLKPKNKKQNAEELRLNFSFLEALKAKDLLEVKFLGAKEGTFGHFFFFKNIYLGCHLLAYRSWMV